MGGNYLVMVFNRPQANKGGQAHGGLGGTKGVLAAGTP
jgi:hypothetical protein